MLIYDYTRAFRLPHEDIPATAAQPAKVVDVEECFCFGGVESCLRNRDVFEVMEKASLKLAIARFDRGRQAQRDVDCRRERIVYDEARASRRRRFRKMSLVVE